MAKAKRLPSGSWRTLESKVVNGKLIRRSFTVSPAECGGDWKKARNLSELQARTWKEDVEYLVQNGETVKLALEGFIADRSKVLSPTTIVKYKQMVQYFEPIFNKLASDITTADLQRLVNDMAMDVKAKTIKNRMGLLLSALDYAGNDRRFKLRYGENDSKKVLAPETEEVYFILQHTSPEMLPILALAAFGGLRRSEIAGLKVGDISRDLNMVYIRGAIVYSENGYVYKGTKTISSKRAVPFPSFVLDLLPEGSDPDAFLFDLTPEAISSRFNRMRRKYNIKPSLHALRHYAATFRSDLNIPRKYIEEVCGWAPGSIVLPARYDNTLDSSRRKFTRIANDYISEHFEDLLRDIG